MQGYSVFDFTRITEGWDTPASRQQRQMAYLRYTFSARAALGSRHLDVACGSGRGLALAQEGAQFVVGGDLMEANLTEAKARIPTARLVRLSSEHLPFTDGAFDVMTCLEAIYYFCDPVAFLCEASRVLAGAGRLVLSWPNPSRPGFHRSPGAQHYPSPEELCEWLDKAGFNCAIWGGFSWAPGSVKARLVDRARRTAVRLNLIPGNLAGRAKLKRLVYRDIASVSALDSIVDIDDVLHTVESGSGPCPYILLVSMATSRKRDSGA